MNVCWQIRSSTSWKMMMILLLCQLLRSELYSKEREKANCLRVLLIHGLFFFIIDSFIFEFGLAHSHACVSLLFLSSSGALMLTNRVLEDVMETSFDPLTNKYFNVLSYLFIVSFFKSNPNCVRKMKICRCFKSKTISLNLKNCFFFTCWNPLIQFWWSVLFCAF